MDNGGYKTIDVCKKQIVNYIKYKSPRLSRLSDEQVAKLYWMWSEERYCAGWLEFNEKAMESFIEWATTSPVERMEK